MKFSHLPSLFIKVYLILSVFLMAGCSINPLSSLTHQAAVSRDYMVSPGNLFTANDIGHGVSIQFPTWCSVVVSGSYIACLSKFDSSILRVHVRPGSHFSPEDLAKHALHVRHIREWRQATVGNKLIYMGTTGTKPDRPANKIGVMILGGIGYVVAGYPDYGFRNDVMDEAIINLIDSAKQLH